jgi:radical SAM protein with 4Fe4S-binding SPASM domain
VRALVAQGTPVGVNHVLTRGNFAGLAETAAHARALGARELQLLRYKPAGRAATEAYLSRRLDPSQVDALGSTLQALAEAHQGALSLRVDCALVPLLSEALTDPEALRRFGVFGCEAGGRLGAVRRNGALAGCSFVTPPASPVKPPRRALAVLWDTSPAVEGFRRWVTAPPEPCASCPVRGVCRGGCKAVSEHLVGCFAPDPECPRVRAASAR